MLNKWVSTWVIQNIIAIIASLLTFYLAIFILPIALGVVQTLLINRLSKNKSSLAWMVNIFFWPICAIFADNLLDVFFWGILHVIFTQLLLNEIFSTKSYQWSLNYGIGLNLILLSTFLNETYGKDHYYLIGLMILSIGICIYLMGVGIWKMSEETEIKNRA